MRIAIIGAGGIGGLYGARLVRAQAADVVFLARGATLDALRCQGLEVRSPAETFRVPVVAMDDAADVGPVDVVLHTTKMTSFRDALDSALPFFGHDTLLVTTQNGVEAPDLAAEVLGLDRVAPGIARVLSRIEAPGVIDFFGGPGSLVFGSRDGTPDPRLEALESALVRAGVPTGIPDDIWVELWAKAMYVVPHGAIGALVDASLDAVRGPLRSTFATAAAEIGAVGRARGVRIPDDAVARTLAFADAMPGDATTSMQRDLLAGLPNELNAQVGAICRMGARLGVPTPVMDVLSQALPYRLGAHR